MSCCQGAAALFRDMIFPSLYAENQMQEKNGCFSLTPMRKAKNLKCKTPVDVFAGRKRPFFKEIFAFAKIFSILGLGFVSGGREGGDLVVWMSLLVGKWLVELKLGLF